MQGMECDLAGIPKTQVEMGCAQRRVQEPRLTEMTGKELE